MKDFIRRLTMPQLGSPVEPVVSITGRRRLVKPHDGYPDPQALRAAELIVSSNADRITSAIFGLPHISNAAVFFQPPHFEQTIDIEAAFEAVRKAWSNPALGAPYSRSQSLSPTFRQSYGPSDSDWLQCPGLRKVPNYCFDSNLADLERRLARASAAMSAPYTDYQQKMLRHVAESTSRPYSEFADAMEKAYRPYWLGVYYRYAEEVWFERLGKGRKGFTLPRGMKRRLKRIYANKVWDMLPNGVRVFRDKRNVDNLQAQFYADAFAAQLRSKSDFGVIHDELWRSV